MHELKKFLVGVASLLLLFPCISSAEIEAIPLYPDSKMVKFPYGKDNSYTILTIPGSQTDIQLGADEKFLYLATGDTTRWAFVHKIGHIFVKPYYGLISTAATLITNKRTYQLTFRSSPEGGKWYQQVAWDYPELEILAAEQEAIQEETAKQEAVKQSNITLTEPGDISVEDLNFGYEIVGEAEFKPHMAFDDGKFTWFRMRNVQELPAIFVADESGSVKLVNYLIKGDYLVIERLMREAILKLGKQEVRVKRTKKKRGVLFGD